VGTAPASLVEPPASGALPELPPSVELPLDPLPEPPPLPPELPDESPLEVPEEEAVPDELSFELLELLELLELSDDPLDPLTPLDPLPPELPPGAEPPLEGEDPQPTVDICVDTCAASRRAIARRVRRTMGETSGRQPLRSRGSPRTLRRGSAVCNSLFGLACPYTPGLHGFAAPHRKSALSLRGTCGVGHEASTR
jgi:hypothetical protein